MITEIINRDNTISIINKRQLTEENIKNKIKQELEKLEYNFAYIGTNYLLDAIYILYSLKKLYNFSLEKEIYPIVANKYGDSTNNIKCDINNATDKMFYDCNEENLKNYLGDYKFYKPGTKKIIRAVLKKIQ